MTTLAVVGSINVDLTVAVDRLPAPGETLLAGGLSRGAGGKGANQAVAAARLLGGGALLVGAVGSDSDGRWVVERLSRSGVDTRFVRIAEGRPTGMALISVDAAGENTIIVNPAANGEAFPVGSELPEADGYILSLEIPMADALRALRGMSGFVACNASPAAPLPDELVERTDLFVVNETEFSAMPELASAAEVVETRGGAGARIHRRGRLVAEIPAVPAERIVSTVGAGDAFCAALVVARLAGLPTEDAVRLAARVGADAVAQPGAQPALRTLGDYADGASLRWEGARPSRARV